MKKSKICRFCDEAAGWTVPLIPFFLPFCRSVSEACIILGFLFIITAKILDGSRRIEKNFVNMAALAVIIVFALSIINSQYFSISMNAMRKWFKYMIIFFITAYAVSSPLRVRRSLFAVMLALAIVIIDGAVQYFTGRDFIRNFPLHPSPFEGVWRVTASYRNPNNLSIYLASVIPLPGAMFLYHYRGVRKAAWGLLAVLGTACLGLTLFRGAALGIIGAAVLFVAVKKDGRLAAAVLCGLLLLCLLLPEPVIGWTRSRSSVVSFFVDESREQHFRTAINMVKSNAFLGVGVGTFMANYKRYRGSDDMFELFYAHNSYLQMAAETGIAGLAVFGVFIAGIMRYYRWGYRRMRSSFEKTVLLGLGGGILAFMSAGMLDSNFYQSKDAVLFWFIAGLAAAVVNVYARRPDGGS